MTTNGFDSSTGSKPPPDDGPTTSRRSTEIEQEGRELLAAAATTFMASQPGAAKRALIRHVPRSDRACSGCPSGTRWPCFVAAIALRVESADRRGPGQIPL